MTEEEIKKLADAISRNTIMLQKEILTLDETVLYTGLKKSYLYKLTSNRAIPHYKPSGKFCFFRREELDAWLTNNPIATNEELNGRALAYCMGTRKSV